jgi:hypothetical protein
MTRLFSSTAWSSIDGTFLFLWFPLAAAACAAQETDARSPSTEAAAGEVIRHGDGQAVAVTLDERCLEVLPDLLAELLAGASPVRLLIDEERIRDVKEGGALEIVFDAERRFATAASAETPGRRVLLPIRDPYWVGTEERPFVVAFLGDEAFGSGPWRNDQGLALLREIEACAEGV